MFEETRKTNSKIRHDFVLNGQTFCLLFFVVFCQKKKKRKYRRDTEAVFLSDLFDPALTWKKLALANYQVSLLCFTL